ncbi:MAG TPA: septum formation initiator family protein [Gaiellaceae bacterium]|jgi:cell division protein FtsB|nr:septum formation initiator family protein [Gaiellaceae bacterium]
MPKSQRRASRRRRRTSVLRWIALATLAIVALLYYRPVKSYVETRSSLQERQAEVRKLREKRDELTRRLEEAETPEDLARRARKLGLVKPGEQLFIVKGIEEWKRRSATRLGGDG